MWALPSTASHQQPGGIRVLVHAGTVLWVLDRAWSVYDPATDTLYVSGVDRRNIPGAVTSAAVPWAMARCWPAITHWSTTQTLAWQTALPEISYCAGHGRPVPVRDARYFCRATVYVIDKTTGLYAGSMSPAANVLTPVGSISSSGLIAYQRSNGDYLLFEEDDGVLQNQYVYHQPQRPSAPAGGDHQPGGSDRRMRSTPTSPSPPPPSRRRAAPSPAWGSMWMASCMGTHDGGRAATVIVIHCRIRRSVCIRSPARRRIRKAPPPPRSAAPYRWRTMG